MEIEERRQVSYTKIRYIVVTLPTILEIKTSTETVLTSKLLNDRVHNFQCSKRRVTAEIERIETGEM